MLVVTQRMVWMRLAMTKVFPYADESRMQPSFVLTG